MRSPLLIFVCLVTQYASSQSLVQTIRGTVYDRDSRNGLYGATITLAEAGLNIVTVTDSLGRFWLENVPVGRVRIRSTYIGYEEFTTDYIIISTAKESEIELPMEEQKNVQEGVVIRAVRNPKQPVNRYAMVSGRSFSPEETQRYAASVNDPGRMALAFPGVQATRDTRNDIVIRGNNPVGMQWRLEGVDVVNPNHFARKGSTGGGITILSLSMLDNSDFITGGMPAEYGDLLSGVFDMHFRKGNNQKREQTFKAGMIGLDYSSEGPIKQGKSSYLFNYRYSTLGLLQAVGLNLVDERETNTFQDFAFNIASTDKSNTAEWNLWGIAGLSKEKFHPEEVNKWKQYDDYAVYDFKTRMAAIGLGNILKLSENSFLKSSLVLLGQRLTFVDDTLNRQLVSTKINDEWYDNSRFALSSSYNYKFSPAANMKAGVYASILFFNLKRDKLNFSTGSYENVTNGSGRTFLLQPYWQMSIKPTNGVTVSPGMHVLHFVLNNKTTFDPRLSIQYKPSQRQTFTAAYGVYSKTLPLGSYFFTINSGNSYPNKDLDMMRSYHYILSFDQLLGKSWRMRIEPYYQKLINIPVANDVNRTFWFLNEIEGYATEHLVSEGKGANKGIDFSLEKSFSGGLFMISSFSVYKSTFQPLNGKEYNTRYNAGTAGSWTGAREWKVDGNKVLQAGWKMIYNGGLRLSPLADIPSTSREPVLDETNPFSGKINPFFRTDGRLALRKDKAKRSWQLALDIQNIFGLKNQDGLSRRYDPSTNQWLYKTQAGIVPVLSYQIDF